MDAALDEVLRALSPRQPGVLMLDYDGTLSPLVPDRERAVPYPGMRDALGRIMDAGTRVVVVSGRPVLEVARLAGLARRPEIWGCHGAERWIPGADEPNLDVPAPMMTAGERLVAWAREAGLGHLVERKPVGVALHWRPLGDEAAERVSHDAWQAWPGLVDGSGLVVRAFDGGIEARPASITKGRAVRTILSETAPGVPVAYLGDDDTDEDAFVALGNRGLPILVRAWPRETAARIRLSPPGGVLDLLAAWASACDGGARGR
jgi:trehalose-phosphatase